MPRESTIQMYDPIREYREHEAEFDAAIKSVILSGNFVGGDQVALLESKLQERVGAKCISVANGTDALFLALYSLGIGAGDEVITVAHTWISTASVIPLTGATPVFVDVDDVSFNIDVTQIAAKLTPKTRAVIAVSFYGQMADFAAIETVVNEYNPKIAVIEDAAQSFGARRDNYTSCSCQHTLIATTSFYPTKPLGCYGDGGAIFVRDPLLASKISAIKNHGCHVRFNYEYIGVNSRLDTLQAAILLVKLSRFDDTLAARRRVADRYTEKLSHRKDIKLPHTLPDSFHVWAQYSILVRDHALREKLFAFLKSHHINCNLYYPVALHTQKCFHYLGYQNQDLPVSARIVDTIINVPCYAQLTLEEQDYILDVLQTGLDTL